MSGNPSGRPKEPADLGELRKLTQAQFQRLLFRFVRMPLPDLKRKLENPETPVLDLMIGRVVFRAIKDGDYKRLDFLLDRMIGKVKEHIEVTENAELAELRKLSLSELIIFVKTNIPEALNAQTMALLHGPDSRQELELGTTRIDSGTDDRATALADGELGIPWVGRAYYVWGPTSRSGL